MTSNDWLYLGAIIAGLNLTWYGIQVIRRKVEATNIATWCMWWILDAAILVATIAARQPWYLAAAYTTGAAVVLAAHLLHGRWKWTPTETVAAAGFTFGLFMWFRHGPVAGIVWLVVAMTAAGIPIYWDMVVKPVRKTFPLWAITAAAGLCTLLGSDGTLGGTILAWAGLIYNGSLALVVLCRRRQAPRIGLRSISMKK